MHKNDQMKIQMKINTCKILPFLQNFVVSCLKNDPLFLDYADSLPPFKKYSLFSENGYEHGIRGGGRGGGCRMFVEETWGVGVGVAVAVGVGVGVVGGGRDCRMFVEETWSKARMQNWNDWVIPTERFFVWSLLGPHARTQGSLRLIVSWHFNYFSLRGEKHAFFYHVFHWRGTKTQFHVYVGYR